MPPLYRHGKHAPWRIGRNARFHFEQAALTLHPPRRIRLRNHARIPILKRKVDDMEMPR